jgi:hypothetical protein
MAQMRVLVGDLYVHESCQRKSLIFGVGRRTWFREKGTSKEFGEIVFGGLISNLCEIINCQRHKAQARSGIGDPGREIEGIV